ncbi:Siroheme synthase [BD1-7 clade bacterium]|uniref:Siroheme synthase n=1 Tax=BD1-7 clade bacterium TaxID=2029982 RepID=A0A5S9QNJ2_9GAMM|nr:Siroheme synthase [BD1-7 clade bacterium]CAA0120865.1 Siroheme synthase [BD1-7 clade bacterium]
MKYLPLFFDISGRHCLIVGGGAIALRKAKLIAKAGGQINVVAPDILPELTQLAEQSLGSCQFRAYQSTDLADQNIVVAATNIPDINAAIADDCHARQLPVNVVDNAALCSFVLPSVIDRDPITIAVSSGGASPVLTRMLRSRIESLIPSAYGRLATFVGHMRETVKSTFATEGERRRFWESVLEGPASEKVLAGDEPAARELFEEQLRSRQKKLPGEVCLIGAGPGDPDLLTFKALRLLQAADVVLYDRLVSPKIVDMARQEAEKIYVGKAMANHALPQDQINQLLIKYAKEGKRVARLKGGDPFIFGRGGEEIEGLAEERIPFQVVPGVTAASGCAAYSGIPLTHRDYAQSVRFVTGHLKEGELDLDWKTLAAPEQTVVFYMGLSNLQVICKNLIEHGRDPNTPIALVQKGTTPDHKVFVGDIGSFCDNIDLETIAAPTLIIVGEVVQLHGQLNWFSPTT